MKIISITRLSKDVEYTTNKDSFIPRVRFQGVKEEHAELLWKIYKLIHLTDYVPERIRDIFKEGTTYESVANKHNVLVGTLRQQAYLYFKRIEELWGNEDVIDLIRYGENIDNEYIINLEKLVDDLLSKSKSVVGSIRDKFSVDILKDANTLQDFTTITREEFTMLRNKLVSFSIPSQEFILKNTDKKLISYGVYLLTTPEENLGLEDRERRKELITFTKVGGN